MSVEILQNTRDGEKINKFVYESSLLSNSLLIFPRSRFICFNKWHTLFVFDFSKQLGLRLTFASKTEIGENFVLVKKIYNFVLSLSNIDFYLSYILFLYRAGLGSIFNFIRVLFIHRCLHLEDAIHQRKLDHSLYTCSCWLSCTYTHIVPNKTKHVWIKLPYLYIICIRTTSKKHQFRSVMPNKTLWLRFESAKKYFFHGLLGPIATMSFTLMVRFCSV